MHDQIKSSLKEAMMAKDTVRLTVIRGLMTAFTNEAIVKGRTPQDKLTDEEALAVIIRSVKQRKDSIKQFTDAGRPELAESEQAELTLLEAYLPAQMSKQEIIDYVAKRKSELGVTDASQSITLIKAVMGELKGKADGKVVKEAIDATLA